MESIIKDMIINLMKSNKLYMLDSEDKWEIHSPAITNGYGLKCYKI